MALRAAGCDDIHREFAEADGFEADIASQNVEGVYRTCWKSETYPKYMKAK
jgi:hypothetical protein